MYFRHIKHSRNSAGLVSEENPEQFPQPSLLFFLCLLHSFRVTGLFQLLQNTVGASRCQVKAGRQLLIGDHPVIPLSRTLIGKWSKKMSASPYLCDPFPVHNSNEEKSLNRQKTSLKSGEAVNLTSWIRSFEITCCQRASGKIIL